MEFDTDKILRRTLYLSKYADTVAADLIGIFGKGDRKIIAAIRDFLDDATTRDISGLMRGGDGSALAQALLKKIETLVSEQKSQSIDYLNENMTDLAEREASVIQAAMAQDNPVVPRTLPIAGTTIADTMTIIAVRSLLEIRQRLIASANDDPAKAIRGTRDERFRNGVLHTRNNNIAATANYIVPGTQNNVYQQAYELYKVKKVDWLGTLDGRLCKICASNELGSPYELGKAPKYPAHPRDRCILIPHFEDLQTRPFVADKRSVKDIPKDERKGKIGQTKDKLDTWFAKQPEDYQRGWLGPSRFELYKAGKLELADLAKGDPARVVRLDDLPEL